MNRFRTGLGIAIAAGGLAAGALARAASYDVIHSSADTITLLDPDAVERLGDGHIRRARSVSVQKNLVSGGPQQPGYVVTQNEYDCAQWTIRWTGFSVYSRFGDLVLHKDNPDPARTPIDNRNFEAAAGARVVCDGREVSRVYAADSIGHLVLALMQAWDAEAPLPPLQQVQHVQPRPAPKAKPPPARPQLTKARLSKPQLSTAGDKAAKPR